MTDAPIAWRYRSLGIEPARFLPWLAGRLRGPIERRPVDNLDGEPGDLVIIMSYAVVTDADARAMNPDNEATIPAVSTAAAILLNSSEPAIKPSPIARAGDKADFR